MDIDQATIAALASNQALFLISLVIFLVSLWIAVRTLGYMTIFALGLVVGVLCSRDIAVALSEVVYLFETTK